MVIAAADGEGGGGFLQLCIGHLAGDGALPDEVVEAALLGRTLNGGAEHVGGTNGLVGFLRSLGVGVVVAALVVVVAAHEFGDDGGRGVEAEFGEVHRVGTHVGDES